MRLHKERVGDKLTEQTVCPSWDCEQVFNDRIELNRHFLENHDAEAIPCVYCVRLLQKDRIRQHIRNEHPHMSHLCTECGRECIYPSALKQHIKGKSEIVCYLSHLFILLYPYFKYIASTPIPLSGVLKYLVSILLK